MILFILHAAFILLVTGWTNINYLSKKMKRKKANIYSHRNNPIVQDAKAAAGLGLGTNGLAD